MAKKFGGKFSPAGEGGNSTASSAIAHAGRDLRATLLFFVPLPLLPAGILHLKAGNSAAMLGSLLGLALLLLAAWLLQQGQIAHQAYNARQTAKRPALPRKIIAADLAGTGVGVATYLAWGQDIWAAVIYGFLAVGLHLFAFGLDPLRDKGMEGQSEFETERVAKAVSAAEAVLIEMQDVISRTGDRDLVARVDGFAATARTMFRTIESDPRDLTAARKYLGVYLKGGRDAAIKYVELVAQAPQDQARADLLALLEDLDAGFSEQKREMLLDDRTDLDVEIDVLRDRLKRDGVQTE